MNNVVNQIISASKTVLKQKVLLAIFLALIPTIGYLLFLIPVKSIPGNDISLQLQLLGTSDYFLLVALAILESLLIVMIIYQFRQHRLNKANITTLGNGNIGLLSGVPAFIFGTKLCPMCIAAIFGGLGPGAVVFALEYRQWIFLASLVVVFYSIYAVSKKINGLCGSCELCKARK